MSLSSSLENGDSQIHSLFILFTLIMLGIKCQETSQLQETYTGLRNRLMKFGGGELSGTDTWQSPLLSCWSRTSWGGVIQICQLFYTFYVNSQTLSHLTLVP